MGFGVSNLGRGGCLMVSGHPLMDVQDAFGFAAREAYRQWFFRNRPLLDLFQELVEGGEFQIRDGLFAVDEDFVCRWNQAIQPKRKY